MALSTKAVEDYVSSGGVRCPYCGSFEISTNDFEISGVELRGGVVCVPAQCSQCGAIYEEQYRLSTIKEVCEGKLSHQVARNRRAMPH